MMNELVWGCFVSILLNSLRLLIRCLREFVRVVLKRYSGGCHASLSLARSLKTGFVAFEFNGEFTMLARPSRRAFLELGRNTP